MDTNGFPMLLTLRIKSAGAQAAVRVHSFGPAGGTVGRSSECDLALPDPSKFISRIQARISFRSGQYVFTEVGTNSSLLNGRPLGEKREAALSPHDKLAIGDYVLEVLLEAGSAGRAAPAAQLQPAPPTPPLFGGQGAPAPLAAGPSFNTGQPDQSAAMDPLGLNLYGGAINLPASANGSPDAYRGAESDHISPETQLLGNLGSGSRNQHFPIPEDYDPLRGLGGSGAGSAITAEPASAATPARARDGAEDAIVQALLSGLGMPNLQTNRSAVDLAQLVGSMLREATAGTMGALLARSLTKRESRIDVTMLAQQANNPLKFFPDADSALKQMLTGDSSAYMRPVRAMVNAFDDLRAHELAVIAAMRAAMTEILQQLSPEALEKRLHGSSAMDKVFQSNRKARLWDSLAEVYEEISLHADDDFQRYFSEKFSAAYEEQIKRIRRASREGS